MFFKTTSLSVKSVAAIQGRAAFLLPLAFILPFKGKLPSIIYLLMGITLT